MKKEGLSKKERLTKNLEFQKVFKYGKKVWIDSLLLILYAPNEVGLRRLGIVVSKKIGKATKRNKVKRWIREIFRKNKELFPEGCDFIIIPHPKIGELSFSEVRAKVLEKLVELKKLR
ncbi:ribonuclease P protein component [Thermodesulfobacterium thermophilum]|uniref:ribonuclease P protein component n=1 Tax=Thermodesulfobacterium thermophilum TaxID=886 RepID=UPI0003B62C13|nr:ribonuclease P protein component [Thermodesulfobacterium thermophilum]